MKVSHLYIYIALQSRADEYFLCLFEDCGMSKGFKVSENLLYTYICISLLGWGAVFENERIGGIKCSGNDSHIFGFKSILQKITVTSMYRVVHKCYGWCQITKLQWVVCSNLVLMH